MELPDGMRVCRGASVPVGCPEWVLLLMMNDLARGYSRLSQSERLNYCNWSMSGRQGMGRSLIYITTLSTSHLKGSLLYRTELYYLRNRAVKIMNLIFRGYRRLACLNRE